MFIVFTYYQELPSLFHWLGMFKGKVAVCILNDVTVTIDQRISNNWVEHFHIVNFLRRFLTEFNCSDQFSLSLLSSYNLGQTFVFTAWQTSKSMESPSLFRVFIIINFWAFIVIIRKETWIPVLIACHYSFNDIDTMIFQMLFFSEVEFQLLTLIFWLDFFVVFYSVDNWFNVGDKTNALFLSLSNCFNRFFVISLCSIHTVNNVNNNDIGFLCL